MRVLMFSRGLYYHLAPIQHADVLWPRDYRQDGGELTPVIIAMAAAGAVATWVRYFLMKAILLSESRSGNAAMAAKHNCAN